MKTLFTPIVLALCFSIVNFSSPLYGQIYNDHFGTGNKVGVTVTSSSTDDENHADQTLSGTGYLPDLVGASRFLGQSSLGSNIENIEHVVDVGIETWIDEQIALAHTPYLEKYMSLHNEITEYIQSELPDQQVDRGRDIMSFTFYESVFKDQDFLRNKAAFSLLQILVVANTGNKLNSRGYGQASYYDILYEGAFSNYRDLLNDVSIHLMMGYYLSHFNNTKGNPAIGTLPDENYAREIMQLFTIGLFELNIDGTYKLNNNGDKIPTYDIVDVQELAKVFTGLSGGAYNLSAFPNLEGSPVTFGRNINRYDMTVPMSMYEQFHDNGEKILVDGTIIPAGQTGMEDIQQALDILFNHPNVGPFIASRLIQQLVKSNPSPNYVKRVALAFNNNGKGVRGDLEAVFKAILLDPEARNCEWLEDAKNGKLKQPLERIISLFKAFDITSPSERLWFADKGALFDKVEQSFMASPTVFNFFSPFYAEDTYVAPNEMVSPEFEILHAVTAIHYLNVIEDGLKRFPFPNKTRINLNNGRLVTNNGDRPFLDFSHEITTLQDSGISGLMDRINLLLCQGQMKENTLSIITHTLKQLEETGNSTPEEIVLEAIYFTMASPDYIILE